MADGLDYIIQMLYWVRPTLLPLFRLVLFKV